MDGQVHSIPDDTAEHYERLITEAEKMRQAGADALKSAYADLRSDLKRLGWSGASISAEVAAFKGGIAEMALAEAEKTKREAKGERVDFYVSLLTRARARGQRKIHDQFDPITGEFVDDEDANPRLIKQVVDGMQTEIGRKALIDGIDMMIAAEEAEERRSDAGLNILTKHEDIAGSSSGKASDFGSEDAGSIPAPASNSEQPGGGGADEVASSALRAGLADPTSNTGEGAANTALPAKSLEAAE